MKLKWTEGIRKEISMSRSILSRRKTGKSALLQRLYNLPVADSELEKKMLALVKSDIVQRGGSNFRYLGVQDNVFDKVFRA